MQPPSLRTPLGVLAIGLLVMALLLVRPADYPVAHKDMLRQRLLRHRHQQQWYNQRVRLLAHQQELCQPQ